MKALTLLLLALPMWPAMSQTRSTTTAVTTAQPSSTHEDLTDRVAAQTWGLSSEDYRRYQVLMKGMRGTISDPRISPIEVLGIHARDDAERRKYAELFARLMAEDTQRVLQFQTEYDRAFKRLYPKLMVVASRPGSRSAQEATQRPDFGQMAVSSLASSQAENAMSRVPAVSPGDRLLVFTADSCKDCDELVRRALAMTDRRVVVDIYLVAAHSADDAQRYARRMAIDPQLVSAQRVTLNMDSGTFSRVLPQQTTLPAIVRKRGQDIVQLASSEL